MSPTQYRALEDLLAAGPDGMLIARGMDVPPGRIHPRTAEALLRRDLAYYRMGSGDDDLRVVITDAGIALLARNPTGEPTRPGAPR